MDLNYRFSYSDVALWTIVGLTVHMCFQHGINAISVIGSGFMIFLGLFGSYTFYKNDQVLKAKEIDEEV